jgi:glyoxylase-like metal-dependent hydrolase (beta-lactamase superfamily II)
MTPNCSEAAVTARIQTIADAGVTVVSRWIFNTYVVHDGGDGAAMIVDPGTPTNGADAVDIVRGLHGHAPGVVVCTHGHADHVAGVMTIADRTGVGYHLPARCDDYLAKRTLPGAPGFRQIAKIAPVLASQPFSLGPLLELRHHVATAGHSADGMVMPLAPAGFLRDGAAVEGAPAWEVLSTPGHTDDSTCLYHHPSATLLSGDTVLTHDGRAWFNPEHLSADASATTEERLRSLRVEHLLPGHGLPISGSDLLGQARSFRDQPTDRRMSSLIARTIGAW